MRYDIAYDPGTPVSLGGKRLDLRQSHFDDGKLCRDKEAVEKN
jgi:hypothetical protein